MSNEIIEKAKNAKEISREMSMMSIEKRNIALQFIIENLHMNEEEILRANDQDISLAREMGLSEVLIERLSLKNRLEGIINNIEQVISMEDPLSGTFDEQVLDNGLCIFKQREPIGVLGIIYESRPNVTLDIAVLTIKSGNCALMRGGSETFNTNRVLIEVIQEALLRAGLPKYAIQGIKNTDRALIMTMLRLHEYIDLIIPRGNSSLQTFCRENSLIPVIFGGIGICHLFVDETANLSKALEVILNAKTQRPTVCNSLDTVLIHHAVAATFISELVEGLSHHGVSFRLDHRAWGLIKHPTCILAQPTDWQTEWLDLILGIKVVDHLHEAIEHIRIHSSGHSDGILTENKQNADIFVKKVDSAAVYVNASTRFTDGSQFGMGSEIAISTQKLHARGPLGLKELTTYKWVIHGDYTTRRG